MTAATPIYRALMLEIERYRVAAGWPAHQLDDAAGTADGYYEKALHADTQSGRQARWDTVQLLIDALLPDGFDLVIRPKKGACIDARKHPRKIRFIRAQYDRKTQREVMREIGAAGAAKGGANRARKLSRRRRRQIARTAALARWRRRRVKAPANRRRSGAAAKRAATTSRSAAAPTIRRRCNAAPGADCSR